MWWFIVLIVITIFIFLRKPKKKIRRSEIENKLYAPGFWEHREPVLDFVMDDGTNIYQTERVNDKERKHVGFYGSKNYSENKKYCVVSIDGSDQDGEGKVALIDTISKQMLYKISIQRPHNCIVSNNGIVICDDWQGWDGEETLNIKISKNGITIK